MTLFQILAALFGLWMMYTIFIYAKKKIIGASELGAWASLWVVFVVIALFPNLLLGISHTLRFSRVFDLLIVGALMVLTVMIFLSYFAQKQTQHQLQNLVKTLAIKEVVPKVSKTKSKA